MVALLVNCPGPDGELAQVWPGVVDDGLVHVEPEGETHGQVCPVQLSAHQECPATQVKVQGYNYKTYVSKKDF